ncbi:MAG: hypothetical protein HY665_06745 [Chloroflexi bacterium]|nr:hypothetical protein [Chloroflexota bacterium]
MKKDSSVNPRSNLVDAIGEALRPLLNSGIFKLEMLESRPREWDYAIAALSTQEGIEVRFTRERGADFYCELVVQNIPVRGNRRMYSGRAFRLIDVLEALGAAPPPNFQGWSDGEAGFIETVKACSMSILEHWSLLATAFDEQHRDITIRAINRNISKRSTASELEALTREGLFKITSMHYDESLSGVRLITLKSKEGIEVRFCWDGMTAKTEVRFKQETNRWFRLDDLLEAVGLEPIRSERGDPVSLALNSAKAIRRGWQTILRAFSSRDRHDTFKRIEEINTKKRPRKSLN